MQNTMPKILAGPFRYLYLTSIVLKNVQWPYKSYAFCEFSQ
jgi:hypothetical protein